MRVSVLVRFGNGPLREINGEAANFSTTGAFFLVPAEVASNPRIENGSDVELTFNFPAQQQPQKTVRCRGKVLRIETTPDGCLGIAVKFDESELSTQS